MIRAHHLRAMSSKSRLGHVVRNSRSKSFYSSSPCTGRKGACVPGWKLLPVPVREVGGGALVVPHERVLRRRVHVYTRRLCVHLPARGYKSQVSHKGVFEPVGNITVGTYIFNTPPHENARIPNAPLLRPPPPPRPRPPRPQAPPPALLLLPPFSKLLPHQRRLRTCTAARW